MADKPTYEQIQACLIRIENSYKGCSNDSFQSKNNCIQRAIKNYQKGLISAQEELDKQRIKCDQDNTECLAKYWNSGSGSGQGSDGVGSVGVWGFISEEDRKKCEKDQEDCYARAQKYYDESISNRKDDFTSDLLSCENSYEKELSYCLNKLDEDRVKCLTTGYTDIVDALGQLLININNIPIEPSLGGIPIIIPHSIGQNNRFGIFGGGGKPAFGN